MTTPFVEGAAGLGFGGGSGDAAVRPRQRLKREIVELARRSTTHAQRTRNARLRVVTIHFSSRIERTFNLIPFALFLFLI